MSIYYTKCGRKFQKNSKAVVTGYKLDLREDGRLNDCVMSAQFEECLSCPFKEFVTEGWPPRFKRWECRAGSKPPNRTTKWVGSLEDKNSIHIYSLDHKLMEEIRQFCEEHPDLGAGYNADHLPDCRRTLAISCSPNKKGIAAKKELIEKFFPETAAVPDEKDTEYKEPHKWDAPGAHRVKSKDLPERNTFAQAQADLGAYAAKHGWETIDGEPAGNLKQDDDLCSKCVEENISIKEGETEMAIFDNQKCIQKAKDCPYYCAHNGGCGLLLAKGSAVEKMLEIGKYNCSVYFEKEMEISTSEKRSFSLKNDNYLPENVTKTGKIVTFDYSSVDEDTAAFLQEKAARITEIRFKSILAIGKELSETFAKFAKVPYGNKTALFDQWCESIGISPRGARNYIQGYDYILKNFQHIEDAESIQPSLLFEVSKPSAPKQLQDAVLSGDIRTHKEYKELEEKLKQETEIREAVQKKAIDLTFELEKTEKSLKEVKQANFDSEKRIRELQQQIEQLKRNADPSKARELGEIIGEKQEEIEELSDALREANNKIAELEKSKKVLVEQLREKPVEVSATQIVEKEIIPDEVALAVYDKVAYLYEGLIKLKDKEIRIFAEQVDPDYEQEVIEGLRNAVHVLTIIESEIVDVQASHAVQALKKISSGISTDEVDGHCGDCAHADMDQVSEDELNEGRTLCMVTGKIMDITDTCGRYKWYGEEKP